jgi:hypothetical protein
MFGEQQGIGIECVIILKRLEPTIEEKYKPLNILPTWINNDHTKPQDSVQQDELYSRHTLRGTGAQ